MCIAPPCALQACGFYPRVSRLLPLYLPASPPCPTCHLRLSPGASPRALQACGFYPRVSRLLPLYLPASPPCPTCHLRLSPGASPRALQACGFYPQVSRLLPLPPNDRKARTSVMTRKGEKVRIHPASINAK